jgi:hypothetical protein
MPKMMIKITMIDLIRPRDDAFSYFTTWYEFIQPHGVIYETSRYNMNDDCS